MRPSISRVAACTVLVASLSIATGAFATDATIGLYADYNGYSCNFSGNNPGLRTAYVVIRPGTAGVRGVRFSAPVPPCLNATWVGETTPDIMASIGTSPVGISISSRYCETEPFYALEIQYLMTGNTEPCCAFNLYPDPFVGYLQAIDCAYNETPITSVVSRFNSNASCACGSIYPAPLPPSQPSPANLATSVGLDPVLQWSTSDPSGLAMSFDVYFGTAQNPPLLAADVPLTGAPAYNPGHLLDDTVYYWRIVMRNVSGAESTGPVWVFTTATNLPPLVINNAPADGAFTTVLPTLRWTASDPEGGILRYDVYLGTAPAPPLLASNLAADSYTPARLPFDTVHWWRIVARDTEGKTTSGPTWSFTTEPDPAPVVSNLSPVCGSSRQPLATTLRWAAQEPYGQAMTYDVYFGTGMLPPLVASNLSTLSYSPGGLEFSTLYSWRVVARDTGGQEASSELCMFATKAPNEPPDSPSNPSPADGAIDRWTSITLGWQCSDPDGGALNFDVYLGKVTPPVAGATIGFYTDATASTCSFGNPSGITTMYVVVKPQSPVGIRGVRFSVLTPDCFDATYLYETVPAALVSIGSSPTGISISSGNCESSPFCVLQIAYQAGGGTTPCCEFAILPDPFTGGIEAVDCDHAATPIRSTRSHVNANATCPCDEPVLPKVASNRTSTSYWVTNLALGSYYQWRIVARDTGGLETVGPLWSFQTRFNQPPVAPSAPSPANGAVNVVSTPTLGWQCSDPEGQFLKYDVYFGTSATPPLVKSNSSGRSYAPGTLAWVTTYWWRVVARDTYGAMTSSATWSFTTKPENLPPGVPALVSPGNNGTGLPINTTLAWSDSDPEGQPLKYDVYLGTEAAPPLVASNVAATAYNPGALAVSTTYRWRVVARDTYGAEAASATWSFKTSSDANLAPRPAANPSPPDGASTENTSPVLSWYAYDPEQQPLTFFVYGGTELSPFLFSASTTVPQYSPGPLEPGRTYHWQVTVQDGHWSIPGPTWSFYLSGGGIPVLVSAFNATAQRDRVEVRWQLTSDEEMDQFTLYRRDGDGEPRVVTQGKAGVKGAFVDTGVEPSRTYHYELLVRAIGGSEFRSAVATVTMPDLEFTLYQNQPNPFNPQTTIRYDLPGHGGAVHVRLLIVDLAGRRVRTLVDEAQPGGARSVVWNGRDDDGQAVASGVYFYVLEAGKQRLTKKLVLLK